MRVCLLYSGWVRTYNQCMQNHIENLKSDSIICVHVNESNTNIDYHKTDIEQYNTNKAGETVVRHTLNQWRNNFLVFDKAPKDCDVYVRMRYDIKLSGLIDFRQYTFSDGLIYIPQGHDYREGINDQFAFGNLNTMTEYYTLYLRHETIFNRGVLFHTETFVKQNLINSGTEIVRIPIQTEIIR